MIEIRPIRSDEDHAEALRAIDALMDARPGTPDGDRLDVLVTLVEAYERQRHPIEPPDPVDAILIAMGDKGLTRADLDAAIGGGARIGAVLSRRRPLTLRMIRVLAPLLGIGVETLVRPYPLTRDVA